MALLAGSGELLEPLAGALRARGWTVHTGREAPEGAERLDLVVDCVEAGGHEAQLAALRETLLLAGRTQPLLERAAGEGRAAFVTVTRLDGRLGLSGTAGVERAALGGVTGLVKTLAIEAPALFCRALDLAPELPAERCAEVFLAELYDAERALTEVGRPADGTRLTVTPADEADPSSPGEPGAGAPGADDLLVVTGGARGVTASCVLGLARRHRTGLLLLGRTPLTEEPGWASGVAEDGLRAAAAAELKRSGAKPSPRAVEAMAREVTAVREIRGTLADLRAAGSAAEYLAVDVSDADAVREALAPHRARVTGVVHGAGVLADGLVRDKKAGDVDRVLATKLTGLRNVLGALDGARVRHVVLFSSVAGFFGNRGQSDYAMANEALNRWACALRAAAPRTRVTSVNWGAWAGGMVTPALEKMFAERGVTLIPVEEGVRYFVEQFSAERAADTVCVVGPRSPLSAREPAPLPAGGLVLRRAMAATAADAVIADHAIGGVPVLPATAAVGGLLGAVHRAAPGTRVTSVRGFQVHKGVVFDDGRPDVLETTVRQADGAPEYEVSVRDGSGRPRYRALLAAGPAPAAARVTGLPQGGDGAPAPYYEDGTLFHGPALRGITGVLDAGRRLVLAARLADPGIARGAWQAPGYSPVLSDLLLQAVLVWARLHRGEAVLPTAVGEVELLAPLPEDEPFRLVVDAVSETASGIRCTVTACTPDGRVLQRMREVEAVPSPGLAEKFAAASGS